MTLNLKHVIVPLFLCFAVHQAPGQALYFEGLHHSPLGNAALSIDTDDDLVVANLQSATSDGVSIALGKADGLVTRLQTKPPTALPNGSMLRDRTIGVLNGVPNQLIQELRFKDAGSTFDLSLNTPADPDALEVHVYAGDDLVAIAKIAEAAQKVLTLNTAELTYSRWAFDPTQLWTIIELPQPRPILVHDANPQLVIGDRIEIGVLSSGPTMGPLETVDILADIGSFTLKDEGLIRFQLENAALGQARLDAQTGQLAVTNIGSSGLDGVRVDLAEASTADLELGLPFASAPDLAELQIRVRGSLGGAPNKTLGTLTVVKNTASQNPYELRADFGDHGVPLADVTLLNAGATVFQATVPTGLIGTSSMPPDQIGKLGPPVPPCFWEKFKGITIFSFPNAPGGPVNAMGDELLILLASAPVTADSLSTFDVTAKNLATVSILDEHVVPVCGEISVYAEPCNPPSGIRPLLHATGCVELGGTISLNVSDAVAGGQAFLALGIQPAPAPLPIGYGCVLLVNPLITLVGPIPLSPSGSAQLAAVVPVGVFTAALQALIPVGTELSASNGLEISNGI